MADDKLKIDIELTTDSSKKNVDTLAEHIKKSLKKPLTELEDQGRKFIKFAGGKLLEIANIDGKKDGIVYQLTAGNKISSGRGSAPYRLGGDFNEEELQKIKSLSGSRINDLKRIVTQSKNRKQREELKAEREQERARKKLQRQQEKDQERQQRETERANREALQRQRGAEFNQIISSTLSGREKKEFELQSAKEELKGLKKAFEDIEDSGSDAYNEINQKIAETQARIQGLQKELKPSKFQKLGKLFERIGLTKAVRGVWNMIISSISSGLNNLASVDESSKSTLAAFSNSLQVIGTALATVIMPILETLKPLLEPLLNIIIKITNAVSELLYNLGLTSRYAKITLKAIDDVQEAGNNFSFDKFEALDAEDNISNIMDIEWFGEGGTTALTSALLEIVNVIGEIIDLVLDIVDILRDIGFFDGMKTFISGIIEEIKGAFEVIKGLLQILTGDFQGAWDSISKGFKDMWNGIKDTIKGGLKIIVSLIFGSDDKNKISEKIKSFLTGKSWSLVNRIGTFANGGMVDSGSLFIAGEAGAELVTTMPSGQTGVTNIAQFKEAQLEALSTWWSYAKYDLPEPSSTYIDGAEIARSKRFVAEMNRKNAGLNLV